MVYTFKDAVDDHNAEHKTKYTEAQILAILRRDFMRYRLRSKRYKEVDVVIETELGT